MTRVHLTRPGRPRARAGAAPAQGAQPARILVRGLTARTIIGFRPDERRKRQDVTIDLDLLVLTEAGRTDRIDDATDYKRIKDEVLHHVETSRFKLLEALAESIAEVCLRHEGVHAAEVTVDKPGALRFARSVAVQVRRERL
jgi:D-erythro-7,8-dihydroneopterin triphosphate epimerase